MKKLLVVVLLVFAGIGAVLMTGSGDDEGPGTAVPSSTPPNRTDPVENPDSIQTTATRVPTAEARREVETPIASSGIDYAQGVEGRVVDKANRPVPGVEIYLIEGTGNDVFTTMLRAQQGVQYPPVARTVSDEEGLFHLGVQTIPEGRTYEVRFISQQYADHTLPNITLMKDQWYDALDVVLERGMSLRGRVTVQGSGLPIAGAEVAVKSQLNQPLMSLTPTPGRENGIIAITDHNGQFQLDNIQPGVVTVSAVAADFARVDRSNVQIKIAEENEINFELPQGMAIGGTVTDSQGVPVPGAKINAIAMSSKTPVNAETRADEAGNFHIIGLLEGPFQLTAIAPGYVKRDVKPVMAGTIDEHIVLETQGSAQLQVVGRNNRAITSYTYLIKSYFDDQQHYGNVLGSTTPQKVHPSDIDKGVFVVGGLNPGSYVFEIHANGYAKSFSDPFTVAVGGAPPLVVARLKTGGTLSGTVVGVDGRPLGGVAVTTMPNFLDENPFTKMFGALVPFKITKTGVKTSGSGQFKIPLLAPGTYQLKFSHADHYDLYVKDHEVAEGLTNDIGRVEMDRGTQVSGTVTVAGVAAAQVKVTISLVVNPAAGQTGMFSAEAVTDNDGRFVLPRRLPPGRYQARAARQMVANPLLQVVDYAKTQQEFAVSRGQETHVIHFALPE